MAVPLTNGVSQVKIEAPKREWNYSSVELYMENIILEADKLSPSPSEKDGLDTTSEYDLRYIGCELIQTAGILLKLPQVAMATAQVLLQRFYYFKSFVNNPMEIFAMASLVLASKIEEVVRRNRDIINVFHYLKYKRANIPPEPLHLDVNYQYIKNQVIKAERKLLRELGFCVHVKHPHKLITVFLQALNCKRRRLTQTAWNYMNDGLRTDIFVRYTPETIACACIYLAARQHKVLFPLNPPWFEVFKCSEGQLKSIALSILYVYVHQPQTLDALDNTIQKLKDQIAEEKAKAKIAALTGMNNNTLQTPAQSLNASPSSKHASPVAKEIKKEKDTKKRSESPLPSEKPQKNSSKLQKKRSTLSEASSRHREGGEKEKPRRNRSRSPVATSGGGGSPAKRSRRYSYSDSDSDSETRSRKHKHRNSRGEGKHRRSGGNKSDYRDRDRERRRHY